MITPAWQMKLLYEISSFVNELLDHVAQEAGSDDTVFHYTNSDGLLGILADRAVWATHIEYLNDSKEFAYARELVEEVIECMSETAVAGVERSMEECFLEGVRRARDVSVFVTSFSEFEDRLSQWRAYGTHVGGYALGFRLADLETIAERNPFGQFTEVRVLRCLYDAEKQRQLVESWYTHVSGWLRAAQANREKWPIGEDFLERLASVMLGRVAPVLKHPAFEEESEWRLIVELMTSYRGSAVRTRSGQTTLIPYLPVPLTTGDEDLQLPSVIIGPTPFRVLARKGLKQALNQHAVDVLDIGETDSPLRPM